MSRLLIGLPKNTLQRIEADTVDLLKLLKNKGFQEKPYERPYQVFARGFDTVKINRADAIAMFNDLEFKGTKYGDIKNHIEKTLSN